MGKVLFKNYCPTLVIKCHIDDGDILAFIIYIKRSNIYAIKYITNIFSLNFNKKIYFNALLIYHKHFLSLLDFRRILNNTLA